MTTGWSSIRFSLICAFAFAIGRSESARAAEPAYQKLRYDEDYSFLRNLPKGRDYLDPLKFIPLDAHGWLTLGGEGRLRYEYFDHALWGQGPQDSDGYLLTRLMLHADLHLNGSFRIFTQMKSGLENGRVGGPRPTDEDRLDFNQAFVDVKLPAGGAGRGLTFRLGRQEISFGSSRLVTFREAPNVRLAFDGLRAILHAGDWRIDALAVEPVQTRTGTFDDGNDPGQKLWGLYAVVPCPALPGGHVDVYYLGLERDTAHFDQGTAREERHTLGSRVWGRANGWDYNFEFFYQFGTFGSDAIAAWSVASDTGYTFAAALRPRLGLKADIISGDRDPHDGTLNTFNPLFPKGAYFNESALIGPANLIDVHPTLEVKPAGSVSVSLDWDFFWRQSRQDGIYNPPGKLVRSGQNADGRYLGHQPSLGVDWHPGRHWDLGAVYARFFAGRTIGETGPGRDVDYFTSWAAYRF